MFWNFCKRFVPVHLIISTIGILPKHKFRNMPIKHMHGKDFISFRGVSYEVPSVTVNGYHEIAI